MLHIVKKCSNARSLRNGGFMIPRELSSSLRTITSSSFIYAKANKSPKSKQKITKQKVKIPVFTTVATLANILNVRYEQLSKRLEEIGFEDLNFNFILDKETAGLIADEFGYEVDFNDDKSSDDLTSTDLTTIDSKFFKPRPPIVTIMGHVDHGKTTILDYLRKSSIVDGEHGGITQHIGAFSVKTPISKKLITFLDTPGHAAFLKMRERGANVTDIVVLVVAADDSIMPQTKEAIKHIKKTGVSVIVAINKCDKESANPDKVIADLAANDIDVEDYGGDTPTVRVSGLTGLNMDKLEETIITYSEILDLKAVSDSKQVPVEGWVIESQFKKGMGPLATVLVRQGSLKKGDVIVAGNTYGKVRSLKDESGKVVKLATPATPVEIWGWKEVPQAGDVVLQAKDEAFAKKVVETRLLREERTKQAKDIDVLNKARLEERKEIEKRERLEELRKFGLSEKDVADEESASVDDTLKQEVVNYIIKADVSGSSEAIVESIADIGNEEVKLSILYSSVGAPTDTDIDRAETANATIICFNVKVPKDIEIKASRKGVTIKNHNIIYHLIEDINAELSAKLAPMIELKVKSETEIKEIFEIKGKRKKITKIAGSKVISGSLEKNKKIRVVRPKSDDNKETVEEVFRGKLETLKHLKDDVVEVKKGRECGVSFENWSDFQPGDIIQVYEEKEIPRFL